MQGEGEVNGERWACMDSFEGARVTNLMRVAA
jgi:hypothetical protein